MFYLIVLRTFLEQYIYIYNNLHIPCLNKGIEQNEILYKMVSENEANNIKRFMYYILPITIVCILMHVSLNIIFHSIFLNSISCGLFSSYGVALTYIISKDVCGEDAKLKKKKKVFNFSGNDKKVALES